MADDVLQPPNPEQAFQDTFAPQAANQDTAFNEAFANPQPAAIADPAPPTQQQVSGPVNVINPEGKLVSIPGEQLGEALANGYQKASQESVDKYAKSEKYGSTGQQLLTALEGAGRGATFGLSTGAETALGVSPEDIKGREEENPVSSTVGEIGGLAASSLIPVAGEANLIAHAGEAAAGLVAKEGAGFIRQIGADAVKGAFEATLLQGGNEIHRAFIEDPSKVAETAIADIGLAAVLGGVFSGTLGAALRKAGIKEMPRSAAEYLEREGSFVSELDRPAMEAGDFETTVRNSDTLKPSEKLSILEDLKAKKPNAAEIIEDAKYLGSPVPEGLITASKSIEKLEDALANGPPTFAALKRQKIWKKVYDSASGGIERALGDDSRYTKAEIGNLMKQSISEQLREQMAPTEALYRELKLNHEMIPLAGNAAKAVGKNLSDIPEFRVSPSSPEGQLIKRVSREIPNLKTVDDVKTYKSILNRSLSPTAPAGEKRMMAIIGDKLKDLEEVSVEGFAKQQMRTPEEREKILGLLEKRKEANKQYAGQMSRIATLTDQLGKGKIHGLEDALHFINERLSPEQITQRLFSKNDSEFLKFFSKNFPEQMQLMREYQKGAFREQAKIGGVFSPTKLITNLGKLEPEIKKTVFTPEELRGLKASKTLLENMPKNYNPSGTANMSALREFFTAHGPQANVRDFAIEKFIKLAGTSPEATEAGALAKSTVKAWKMTDKAVKSVFNSDKSTLPTAIAASELSRKKIDKQVQEYTKNPEKMLDIGNDNPLPDYAKTFAETSARAVQYLASLRPNEDKRSPLDSKPTPSPIQKATYNRALDIAQQPLLVLQHIKEGTLTSQDMKTLNAIYPSLYKKLNENLSHEMIESVDKEKIIPYKTRLGLSMFMTQPLDSTMTPNAIISAQPMPKNEPQGAQNGQDAQGQRPKHSMNSLNKLPKAYQTSSQALEGRKARD